MGKFVVTGDKALDKALKDLEPKIAKRVIRAAMRRALAPMKTAVKENAPVGATAEIRSDVKVRAGKRKKNQITMSVMISAVDSESAWHAQVVEYGTRFQPPQGYMRRAFDEKASSCRDGVIEEIRAGVEKEASRGA